MDRQGLLKRVETAWNDLREAYSGLTEQRLMIPGVMGQWSVRDILAHVTTWEEEALNYLPLILKGGRPPRYSLTYGGIDAFNALKTEEKRGLTLAEVMQSMHDIHRRLIAYIESVPESQFQGETPFRSASGSTPTAIIQSMPKQFGDGGKSKASVASKLL